MLDEVLASGLYFLSHHPLQLGRLLPCGVRGDAKQKKETNDEIEIG